MIIDTLANSASYHHLSPRFVAGLKWLTQFKPDMPDGRTDIDGDNVFALVQSYETAPADQKKFESHRVYADIQYVGAGTEVIPYAPTSSLNPTMAYDAEKDYLLYTDPAASTPLFLPPGSFAIFLPQDGHKPGCVSGASAKIKKVVIKVRV